MHDLTPPVTSSAGAPTHDRWYDRIPAHWRYPGMVVALLCSTVVSQAVLLTSALSDGGAQVEPDYYARAVRWDASQEQALAAASLGWQLRADRDDDTTRELLLTVHGASGAPIDGLRGAVVLRRPHLSEPLWSGELSALRQAAPGRFVLPLPGEQVRGVWDVELALQDDSGALMQRTVRHDLAAKR